MFHIYYPIIKYDLDNHLNPTLSLLNLVLKLVHTWSRCKYRNSELRQQCLFWSKFQILGLLLLMERIKIEEHREWLNMQQLLLHLYCCNQF